MSTLRPVWTVVLPKMARSSSFHLEARMPYMGTSCPAWEGVVLEVSRVPSCLSMALPCQCLLFLCFLSPLGGRVGRQEERGEARRTESLPGSTVFR